MNTPSFADAVKDEGLLRESLAQADIVPVLMVTVQLTGDLALLDEVASYIKGAWSFQEQIPDALRERIRERLVTALKARAAADAAPAPLDDATLQRLMSAAVGQPVVAEYVPLMREEMQLDGVDHRVVPWHQAPPSQLPFKVLVVGAGFSGLCMGIRLKQMGLPFTILEKNDNVGGTWLENTYPGCAVDTPNHFFSYSFHAHNDWSHHFSKQPEIQAYIEGTADHYGMREHIRFGVEVVEADYDEAAALWRVQVRDRTGRSETLVCNALVTAVGQLNRPALPKIPGLEAFGGPSFHTARWDHSVSLAGKRVAMIGTGASGMQAGPSIAPEVAQLTVFQRSPHWATSNPNYHKAVTPGMKWALNHVPYLSQWLRFQLFIASSDGFHASLKVDPAWPHQDRSLNAANDQMRQTITDYVRQQLDGDEELIRKCIPDYPPYGKRMLRDNHWYQMLKRDNVELENTPIDRIEPGAIVMKDGRRIEVDVIVFATGFQAAKVLWPMEIRGREGQSIRALWGEDDPRAYLGMSVPGFPNLFVTFGPATNLAHGGSAVFHFECQVRYIQQALREMIERGAASVEVRRDVHDRYNERVDGLHRGMVWAHPGVRNWYKNKANRVTLTSPWRLVDYWSLTREFQPAEFVFEPATRRPAGAAAATAAA